ncbi:MAG: hypothetical protein GY775_16025 [Candidatus Scalindua sp.]|nr:hypothetical protein [Candidatus Scalindua sp.]
MTTVFMTAAVMMEDQKEVHFITKEVFEKEHKEEVCYYIHGVICIGVFRASSILLSTDHALPYMYVITIAGC